MTCEEAQTLALLGDSRAAARHRATCARCATAQVRLDNLGQRLAAYRVADPAPGHIERTMAAAAGMLATRAAAQREPRRRLFWAVTVVLGLLPLVVAADAQLVRIAHTILSGFLPPYLTTYLVGSLALFLVLLLAFGCAAVPLLAARQKFRPLELEESHA